MTTQRRLLVDIIQDSPRHLDAARLLEIARKQDPDIDRATVYRTLALLENRGSIDELDLTNIEGEKPITRPKPIEITATWLLPVWRDHGIRESSSKTETRDGQAEWPSDPGSPPGSGWICKWCQKGSTL